MYNDIHEENTSSSNGTLPIFPKHQVNKDLEIIVKESYQHAQLKLPGRKYAMSGGREMKKNSNMGGGTLPCQIDTLI